MILGLAGRKGAGKSTVANELEKHQGFKVMAMAFPMRVMLSDLVGGDAYNTTEEEKVKPRDELCGKSIRYALQTLGTEWGRNMLGPDIWVKAMEKHIKQGGHNKVVIDDIRFPNEVDMIQRLGGFVIWLGSEELSDEHESERSINAHDCDFHIPTDQGVLETVEAVEGVLDWMNGDTDADSHEQTFHPLTPSELRDLHNRMAEGED